MTPEEYINKVKKDRWDRLSGGWLGTFVTEEDALAAVELARGEKQEPASEDLVKEIDRYFNTEGIPVTGGALRDTARHFAQWQKEQMMKDAIDATVTDIRNYREENEVDFTIMLDKGIVPYVLEEEVKVIIIKE